MKRSEFVSKLNQLRGATSISAARMLVHELRAPASRVDALLRDDFRRAASRFELPIPEFTGVELRPGETWLLLYEAPQNGCAVRLCAKFDGSTGDSQLQSEVRRAHRGLLSTAGRACRDLERPTPPSIEIDAPYGNFEIEGSSLGLSVAIATLSVVLNRSAATHVAGSAQVTDDGRLRHVEHLAPKLDALHRSWPEVSRVVVAWGQRLPEGYRSPVEILEADHLSEAIPLFGLSLDALRPARLDEYRVRVAQFRTDNNQAAGPSEWARLSSVAWETSAALAVDEPGKSAEAAIWAALFAVHAGDPRGADALLERVPEDVTGEFPELLTRKLIISASKMIDGDDFHGAVELAARAAKLCESLSASDRRDLIGQATGTQGRALMHLGDLQRAEHHLREGLEHHRSHMKAESPRSACYVATCLRLQGRLDEALLLVNDALADVQRSKWGVAVATRLFLHLERGRIYLALHQWEAALADFQIVRDGQLDDVSYPRLAAVRGLARTLRVLGKIEEADLALAACIAIARGANAPILQKVAAMAVGDALIDATATSVPRGELEAVWHAVFGGDGRPSTIEATIRTWVY